MKNAASMQVVKRGAKEGMAKRMADNKIIEFRRSKADRPDVLRLHLELNMKYVS